MTTNTGKKFPDETWIASLQEPIIEADPAIIDPHHHLSVRKGHICLIPELAVDLSCGHNLIRRVAERNFFY